MYETFGYKQKLESEYNLKVFTDNVEFECLQQTENLLKQEVFKGCKVRLMPDTHAGKGAVIGFTADLGDKVIPNIVGVDIRLWYVMCTIRKYRNKPKMDR